MVIFNQQNYQNYLGNTKFTIARWGCLVTVITMISDYIYGQSKDPVAISKKLSFLNTGDLVWGSLDNLGLKLVSRVRYFSRPLIDEAFKDPNKYVALQVNNSHWVWVIGRYIPYFGYKIVDPWGGVKTYTNKYKNNITGHAVIAKK